MNDHLAVGAEAATVAGGAPDVVPSAAVAAAAAVTHEEAGSSPGFRITAKWVFWSWGFFVPRKRLTSFYCKMGFLNLSFFVPCKRLQLLFAFIALRRDRKAKLEFVRNSRIFGGRPQCLFPAAPRWARQLVNR